MNAMILAAGLGTRLRPYSLLRPKPLFPVLDRPLLSRTIDTLRRAHFDTLVVNAHHLREQIVSLLQTEKDVVVQQEDEILGTGGGLRKAWGHFSGEPLLVINGDIYHTIDLGRVYEQHCSSGAAVTMVLHDCPRFNKVSVAADGRILDFGGEAGPESFRRLAFTGIHVLDPAVLQLIPADTFYDILDCYRTVIRQGGEVRALEVRDHYWTDMGTPEDYLALHAYLLQGGGCPGEPASPTLFVSESAELGRGVNLSDWVSIGAKARIGAGASLSRVVVWDGAEVTPGEHLHDAIVI